MIYSLKMKNMLIFLFILIPNFVLAGCGSCQAKDETTIVEKTNSLVTVIPDSGSIEGFAITSCGMCNFDYKEKRGCSLTIKVEDIVSKIKKIIS